MALQNYRGAWVNRSSTQIPVYGDLTSSPIHVGGYTVNTANQIGSIWTNEFYILYKNVASLTYYKIKFKKSANKKSIGNQRKLQTSERE